MKIPLTSFPYKFKLDIFESCYVNAIDVVT